MQRSGTSQEESPWDSGSSSREHTFGTVGRASTQVTTTTAFVASASSLTTSSVRVIVALVATAHADVSGMMH